MSSKVTVKPSGHTFTVEEDESVLDAAIRNGLAFPYACRGGACGVCKGKVIEGDIHYDDEPMALTEEEAAVGMALFCVGKCKGDMSIEVKEVGAVEEIPVTRHQATISKLDFLNDDVAVLGLTLDNNERLQYLAGQYLSFILPDGRKRAFSIANAPHDDECLEFHIRKVSGGQFTEDLFSGVTKVGSRLEIEGPHGTFFVREDSERPMLMLATGTGFGPIKAMVDHLVAEQSTRPVYLYWGARTEDGLYYDTLVKAWTAKFPNIHYRPVLSQADDSWDGRRGRVQTAVAEDFSDLSEFELYACGHPDMVYTAKDMLVGKGINPDNCYSDAFEYASN